MIHVVCGKYEHAIETKYDLPPPLKKILLRSANEISRYLMCLII